MTQRTSSVPEHADRSANCEDSKKLPWAAVEFFAGMGGMRCASALSGACVRIAAAYDISEVCRRAYCHNFGSADFHLKTIECLALEELDACGADLWLLSPPCQPFTRSGRRQDHEDKRTAGFLHLIALLPFLHHPPKRVLLENVVGFERSQCRDRLLVVLVSMGWEAAEFLLDPETFGIPNRRPRYYGLFRASVAGELAAKGCMWRPAAQLLQLGAEEPPLLLGASRSLWPPPPLGSLLQKPEALAAEEASLGCSLEVPQHVMLERVAKDGRYDLHLRSDRTSACLTKVNGRLPRGFSPLVVVDEAEAGPLEQKPKVSAQGEGPGSATDHIWKPGVRVRYLSPREQLRLLGYPASYEFPADLSFRDRCSLLGNSLNVHIVAWVLRQLLPEGLDSPEDTVEPLALADTMTTRGWGPRERLCGSAGRASRV
mmetsp:Transcript_83683/g.194619  ORF Transcript_83683/g.194619 Transcript_83683/m.194619 type:complete len:429 (-) Transcript_83683:51-1337(-)|eukprot:CAMPEP_0171083630 /NCGR_PEP_ID=MMETSP0766_2-20121228/17832_1 /TAXON_ID=439317 /ORGANISM="Gambierdiscus australes, Strain CAWD 149" /LENGTH=428 /DNA_ID=CAMNT_0011541071 /DNA_START=23 /DNA_END=1309 /DNA_ORIENTATION=+